jgi:hypothetical protein
MIPRRCPGRPSSTELGAPMTDGTARIPGFIAGTWRLDLAHSDVGFVDGYLTIRGTTRPVTLDLTVNGFSPDTGTAPLEIQMRQLRPGSHIKLPEHLDQVVFHRALADEELSGDLAVGQALPGKAGDLGFLRGQPRL